MIRVEDVYKRYHTQHGPGKWVLQGVSFSIPAKVNVGLVGRNGAGKSTLLRLIGGVDRPDHGIIERCCRVSWPMGSGSGVHGTLTGRQNVKFICRIHGHDADLLERIRFVEDFAELGEAFDDPVYTYSSGMKSRLQFGLSLAFDFDVYISDENFAAGDAAFREKARKAFDALVDQAGLIMVSHNEVMLRQFCTAGIWLHEGRAHWFDNINDALSAYRDSLPNAQKQAAVPQPQKKAGPETGGAAAPPAAMPKTEPQKKSGRKKLNGQRSEQWLREILAQGLRGEPATVSVEECGHLTRHAKRNGFVLVSEKKISKRGYRLKKDAVPILRKHIEAPVEKNIALYDLQSQCVKVVTT
jgi:capsular polysaccharide transport system ATP-binding protein